MCAEHQQLSLEDGLIAQRKVHSHLVAVEVSVECRTSQRMQLYGLAFNHLGLEGLDAEAVKCRGTVEQYRVALHYVFKNIPNHRFFAVYNLLGALHGLHNAALNEFADDEGLVKLGCHQFGYAALVHLQLRTYHDYRTCRIVNTFTEQVLTEAALFAFQAV